MNKLYDILTQNTVKKRPLINGCLNYTGGKFKLLPQILPHFPKDINTFVDLFCGGCSIGLNIDCNKVIYNDRDNHIIELYQTFKIYNIDKIISAVHKTIDDYGLKHKSESADRPLQNKCYLKLREDYNILPRHTFESNIMLYVLITFSMNNYIRYNSNDEFNVPIGKRDFNQNMKDKILKFITRIQTKIASL